ncbi:MAG: 2Fe-2S iron-sulfur cluster binding domain-containing protein [Comamonadaceae bacterium]|nr:MAG: 2Fe-2S iron-sulfur cluster binding domain-containing protein [Comamonadaceae bacterium]
MRRGQPVTLHDVPPDRTLLDLLREDLGATGTKEGCGEGDCGACTVVLGEARGGHVHYQAINSCIRLAHSVDGMALWTVEDLSEDPLIQPAPLAAVAPADTDTDADADTDGERAPHSASTRLHPAQEAMVQCHGSQCGFCTPGFVMSLFGMYQKHVAPTLPAARVSQPPEGAQPALGRPGGGLHVAPTLPAARGSLPPTVPGARTGTCQPQAITRAIAAEELSGNLCRCTGYRPILDAAQHMQHLPPMQVQEELLLQQLEQLALTPQALEADQAYIAPTTLAALLAARSAYPDAQIVAGATDVGLWITKQHRRFARLLDVTRAQELRRVHEDSQADGRRTLVIGAAVSLSDAFDALRRHWPQLHRFHTRFAGLPVRNSGTLGGNVANGSPIGDSMPLLIALGAHVVLASVRGERSLALEDLYTGYRQNVMAPDELVVRIAVPLPAPATDSDDKLAAYKVSKRYDDDISAVCLVMRLTVAGGTVHSARIGAGGVAATPARARQTEAALIGQPWDAATFERAAAVLQAEFQPISDMRASGAYRRSVLGSLVQRFWLEHQGGAQPASLDQFTMEVLA